MSKFQVLLWAEEPNAAFFKALRDYAQSLSERAGLRSVQLNLADADVAAAADKRMSAQNAELFDAMLSWQSEGEAAEVLATLPPTCKRLACYEVDAEEPLPHRGRAEKGGERTPGFSQVALLRCPGFLSYEQWLSDWKGRHTKVAIETQSTFRYVQNRVLTRPPEATAYDAVVEECFPAEAMHDAEAFYDAKGKPALLAERLQTMMESCAKFIDFNEIEVVPTSEYRF